ncbi:hypothetical protein [Bermanella sp. R86510]|uniref:hypothetical protein n=1 Tax=unclassified Bermanella TaxID=2627862 RepID=UPI0037C5FE50
MDKGLISYFEVKHCGFYSTSIKDPVLMEGSLEETLDSFCEWVKDRDFTQTIPWDVDSHPKRTQIYCKSIAQDPSTKDTLLVLWKRFGDDSGKVSGISPDAKVSQDTSDSIKIDPKVKGQSAILGQPMYYWVIPSLDIIATVNFSHSCAATKEVTDYIKRCIDYRVPHPRKHVVETESENPNTGEPIIRKSVSYRSDDGKSVMRFKLFASTKELNSDKANAERLSQKISHIVVRDTISTTKADEKDSLFKLWEKVKGKKKFSKHIEIIEEATLTPSEVSEIIKVHNAEYNSKNKWNNIGFRESGNDSTKWLNRYVSREHVLLPFLAGNNNYYSASTVLNNLLKNRSDLLLQVSTSLKSKNDEEKSAAGG